MKIKYIHNLEYSYEESVQLGEHRLCIKPRSHGFQRLINFNLNISPNPKILYPLLAASGEEINRITFEGYTDSLSIKAISEVETLKHPCILDGVKERDLTLPFCRSIINRDLQGALEGWMPNGQHDPSAVELAQESLAGSSNNALSFTFQLIEIIQDRVKYTKRHTGPAWPASRTLRERVGSCRDLAMLMVESCRSVGIPSRFVSGYHFEDPLPKEFELHAWAELYIPGAGWRGFDPSGKGLIDERYLTLVSSSKSNLTAVITGNFRGKTNLKNNLTWEIKPLEICN
ncbi:transglutaminase family protein [uncultured Prochlorococcus sp.]|jgi:transglutaminase-like putative cysteine protease|uniref:transglutaminase family protein n=1 Tax=Prochlorococcus sp. TaxID=1220 RepID=UPI000E08C1CC|nr:transglutaminase family protein [uncultured Prochlorococcus sp.]MDC3137580.1 transglutaminase family protein [Prochlorococcus sp. AH-716-I19]MDC3203787.1 transglutaminase family protein [Prochlorococcus sp. AH-716-B04]RCL48752.1 MAG: transglutaminase family protein [Prochlorococcus sp. MED-G72]|tara:strand:+ start:420 stop:1280 length:861 start_codon:yes stop_codon:yes gene_type:complete